MRYVIAVAIVFPWSLLIAVVVFLWSRRRKKIKSLMWVDGDNGDMK